MRSILVITTFTLLLKTFVNEQGFFRSSDGHTTSDTRDLSERDIDSEEVEKRGFRANNKARSVSEDINVDVQSVEYEDEEEHVEARGFRGNQRSVEEDEASEEDQELEARGFRSNQRSVEERGFRSNQRSVAGVEARGFRSNQKRKAEAEPGFRSNQKRSTWASGLIEALKARGFSSAALVQPK
ncbi:hypothetical protein DPSP01_014177 [Paraphaeosphaeria sporulosa]